MKLAVSTYSLHKWRAAHNKSLEQSIDWIAKLPAELNTHAVEIVGLEQPYIDAKSPAIKKAVAIKKRCEKLNLDIAGYCIGAELLLPPKQQKNEIARLKRQVDIAATLGVKSMRHDVTRGFDSYKNYRGPKSLAAALKIINPAIREVADYAQSKGVITTLENHGFFMQAATRVEKLLTTVNHKNFQLTLDLGNFLCVDDDPVQAVQRLAKFAVLVHAKDFHVKPKKQMPPSGWSATPKSIAIRGAIAGHGNVDLPAQLKLLKRAKYQGFLSLEFEGMEDPTIAIPAGLQYLNKLLNNK